MDPTVLASIFDAFDQGQGDIAKEFGGLGLGLAITKAFVVAHGGTIAASSGGVDQGATFTMRLPLVEDIAVFKADFQVRPTLPAVEKQSVKILLVDDHADTLVSLGRLLTRRGHLVTTAATCAEGVKLALTETFDIIISDLGLPDRSGNELIREIRLKSDIPAIALSGYGMENDLSVSKSAGFNKHLTKPVHVALLQDYIEELLRSSAK